jgi:hypothetical protein
MTAIMKFKKIIELIKTAAVQKIHIAYNINGFFYSAKVSSSKSPRAVLNDIKKYPNSPMPT